MQKIQFEGIDAKQKCSKQNKMITNKRLHSATYPRLQLAMLLCLLASDLILTVCYVEMFPRIGENCTVTEHTTHQNLPYNDMFPSYLRKRYKLPVQYCTNDHLRWPTATYVFPCNSVANSTRMVAPGSEWQG